MIRRLLKLIGLMLLARTFGRRETTTAVVPVQVKPAKESWKWWIVRGSILFAALGLGGFLFAASGIASIKASSRHWAITEWFLNFSKERSVATHSMGIKPPPLDVDWRVMKGAGHFETGCRPCHGSPGLALPRVPYAMTPNAPWLGPEVADWDPAELFYIIKHGIKFTGMPAWPAKNRDDEVWAVVAFLQKLPGLDKDSYRGLVHGDAAPDPDVALQELFPPKGIRNLVIQNCSRCHGADGNGRGTGAFPKLAGQKREYLLASLAAYAAGERPSGVMEPIAAELEPPVMQELADYYSLLRRTTAKQSNQAAPDRGRIIATFGIPEKGVPACAECHLPNTGPKNPIYPILAGQYPEYITLQLELFKAAHRGGTSYAHIMHHVAKNLDEQEINDVAAFFASLPPQENSP